MPPPLIGGCIKGCFCLPSDVCLSVTYIWNNSRTERHMKTEIGTEVAHVTRDSDTTFKVKGQGHQAGLLTAAFTHRQLQQSAWERIERGNCCYIAVCRRGCRLCGARRYGAHAGRRGAGAYRVATRTACYYPDSTQTFGQR